MRITTHSRAEKKHQKENTGWDAGSNYKTRLSNPLPNIPTEKLLYFQS